jgi:catechol 2,3-dioxygenase-like lactoylglutathione lyase family enzyme
MTVWYRVRDFDAGRAFYRETLGFEETFVDWQERWARLTRGEMDIAIAEGDPEDGVFELHGHVRLLDVYDPDGNRIQLAQDLVGP